MANPKFPYATAAEFSAAAGRMGLDLPVSEDVTILARPIRIGRREAANRLVVHPMEGCDAGPDGGPTDLTFRRYERWAGGGAGLVWFEACAVVHEGRSKPRQLYINEQSVAGFAELVRRTRAAAPAGVRPLLVLQLTHSGRYSRPAGQLTPVIAQHCPELDEYVKIGPDYPLISDAELDALQDTYARAAALAAQAGFDAVDVKACHCYLLNELLGARTRPGRYGGDYANRTRFQRETAAKVRAAVGGQAEIVSRLNVYDGLPYPYGWGVAEAALPPPADGGYHPPGPDLAEPIRLVRELVDAGLSCLSVTVGNPRYRPHFNRPYDGGAVDPPPPEPALVGVARLVDLTRQVQQACPELPVIGAGLSWPRQWFPQLGAAIVRNGWAGMVGLGRGALAYPDFALDIVRHGRLEESKVCVICGGCTQLMRDGGPVGCIVRDRSVYGPIYQAARQRAAKA